MSGSIDAFRQLDTEPFGVNPAEAASHRAFIEAHNFPFDLLVDEGRLVAEAYGAIKPDGSGIQRTVVLVGKDGRVLFRAAGAPPPAEILAVLEQAENGAEDSSRGAVDG